jgi:hypothetical protein
VLTVLQVAVVGQEEAKFSRTELCANFYVINAHEPRIGGSLALP